MEQPEPIPHMTRPPRKPKTRGDSKKEEQDKKNQDTHHDTDNSSQEDNSNHTPTTSDMPPAQQYAERNADAAGLSNNDITSMVAHVVQGIATASAAPAHLCPSSAIATNTSMGERQDPDGSSQVNLPPVPPPALHTPHEYNKGGARTPKDEHRARWPHQRPAFKAAAVAAAATAVGLLNPGGQSVRLSDVTF